MDTTKASSQRTPQAVFIEMLARLNAKERNFLMRYALSHTLAPSFVDDLVAQLEEAGVANLKGARAAYFGMDYHLEWTYAALLVATGVLVLDSTSTSMPRVGGQSKRVEDVDLVVVLTRTDGTLVLVLLEAKGITSFDTAQFASKVSRLRELNAAVDAARGWLTPIMLLTSPDVSKPTARNLARFAKALSASDVGFWPAGDIDPTLIWMPLKGFFQDLTSPDQSLRIGTCYGSGARAKTMSERTTLPYDHWRVEPRRVVSKPRP